MKKVYVLKSIKNYVTYELLHFSSKKTAIQQFDKLVKYYQDKYNKGISYPSTDTIDRLHIIEGYVISVSTFEIRTKVSNYID